MERTRRKCAETVVFATPQLEAVSHVVELPIRIVQLHAKPGVAKGAAAEPFMHRSGLAGLELHERQDALGAGLVVDVQAAALRAGKVSVPVLVADS